jgi:hypothetical protein
METHRDLRPKLLYKAIESRDSTAAISLINSGVDVNGSWKGGTHLWRASRYSLTTVVANLLEQGADCNTVAPGRWSPLECAAYWGYQDIIELLITIGGADVHQQDLNGRTPLHWSSFRGHMHVTKYLVSRGCNADIKDRYGETSLDFAVQSKHYDVKNFLVQATQHRQNHNYRELIQLCTMSSPYLESMLQPASLRVAAILSVNRARLLLSTNLDTTTRNNLNPLLVKIASVPDASKNSKPGTVSQVLRIILTFVGKGFDLDAGEEEKEEEEGGGSVAEVLRRARGKRGREE